MKAENFLPDDYMPAEDEPFMNDKQLEYFRRKLHAWRSDILEGSRDTVESMKGGTRNIPDVADRASEETDRALELRTRDRERKLVSKIDAVELTVDAAISGERNKMVEALLADGTVTEPDKAARLTDDLIAGHHAFLPQFG